MSTSDITPPQQTPKILDFLDFSGFRGCCCFSNCFLVFLAFPLCPKCSWTFWDQFCNNRCSKLLSGVHIGPFFVFLDQVWDKLWTNYRAQILQGLRTGGHPDGNIFEKRHLFFQGPGFYMDCEQGVTLTDCFLTTPFFHGGA